MTPIQKALIVLIVNYITHLKQSQRMEKVKIQNGSAMPKEEEPTKLVEVIEIPGTPFNAVKKDELWFVAWKNYKLCPDQDTYKACLEELETNMWKVVGSYTVAILQEYERSMRNEINEMTREHQAMKEQ